MSDENGTVRRVLKPTEASRASAGKPGRDWLLQYYKPDTSVKIESQGDFDELILDDWLHLERMSERVWWLRVGDARILVEVTEQGETIVEIQRDCYDG